MICNLFHWAIDPLAFSQVNPFRTPQVVGALIDAGCPEDQVRIQLSNSLYFT